MAVIVECKDFNCDKNKNGKCILKNVRMIVVENELECEEVEDWELEK